MDNFFTRFLAGIGRLVFYGKKVDLSPAPIYLEMRQRVLSLTADKVGQKPEEPITALLMETGCREAVVSLVAVIDGTVSIYFSNGGGIIGVGQNESVRRAALGFLGTAHRMSAELKPAAETPLPEVGRTKFYLLGREGLLSGDFREDDLGKGLEKISPPFHAGHNLIAQIRLVEQTSGSSETAS